MVILLKITNPLSILCGVIICGLLVALLYGFSSLYFLLLNAEQNGIDPNLLFNTLYYAQRNMLLLLTATASLGVLTSYFSIYMLERPLNWHDRPKSTLAVFPTIIIVMLFLQITPYQQISRSLALVDYNLHEAVMSISISKIFAIGQIALWTLLLGMFVFSYAKVFTRVKPQKTIVDARALKKANMLCLYLESSDIARLNC